MVRGATTLSPFTVVLGCVVAVPVVGGLPYPHPPRGRRPRGHVWPWVNGLPRMATTPHTLYPPVVSLWPSLWCGVVCVGRVCKAGPLQADHNVRIDEVNTPRTPPPHAPHPTTVEPGTGSTAMHAPPPLRLANIYR